MNRIFLVAMTVVLAALTAPGAPRGKAPAASKAKPPAALKVKSGNYTPGGKLTRREFVEKTFGVKFGDEIDKNIEAESKVRAEAQPNRQIDEDDDGLEPLNINQLTGYTDKNGELTDKF